MGAGVVLNRKCRNSKVRQSVPLRPSKDIGRDEMPPDFAPIGEFDVSEAKRLPLQVRGWLKRECSIVPEDGS
jgi:hypothetical protein